MWERAWVLPLMCLMGACAGKGGAAASSARELPESCESFRLDDPDASLDDFEDGDELLRDADGFQGRWYVENDGTGSQTPAADDPARALIIAPGAPASAKRSLHTRGGGFENWGAFVGVRLNEARASVCSVDISLATGLRFSAKGAGKLRVNLSTPSTTPTVDGGECAAEACSDFGKPITLEEAWRELELPFDSLTQPDWAEPAPWQPERVLRLSFWGERGDFDIWLDAVRLY